MNHLETLVFQWLEFRGYIVQCNVNVGRLAHGGHTGEIDIAAYHPILKHCLHVECSGDATSWKDREKRFKQKFAKGREFIGKEVFPWLDDIGNIGLEQWAVLWMAGRGRVTVGGGKIVTLRRLYRNIARDVLKLKKKGNRVFPEKYSFLRTIQGAMQHIGSFAPEDATSSDDDPLLPDAPQ